MKKSSYSAACPAVKAFTSAIFIAAVGLTALSGTLSSVTAAESGMLSHNDEYVFTIGDSVTDTSAYGKAEPLTDEAIAGLVDEGVSAEKIKCLLLAGSTMDIHGYIGKYGISESKAYRLTQKALSVLTGELGHKKAAEGLSSSERSYLAAVLKAGFDKTKYSDRLSPSVKNPSYVTGSDGKVTVGPLSLDGILGGVFRFDSLPKDVHIYTLSGDEAPVLRVGQSFYFRADKNFSADALSVEYLYRKPIAVVYKSEASDSVLVTAFLSTETTERTKQVVSLLINPDTSDTEALNPALPTAAALFLSVICVKHHFGRKQRKLGVDRL